MSATVDCEMKGINIGARRARLSVVESICAGGCICYVIPCILITGCYYERAVVMLGYGEMQGVRAEAIISVVIVVCVCTILGVVDFMPSVLFAGILVIGVVCTMVDS